MQYCKFEVLPEKTGRAEKNLYGRLTLNDLTDKFHFSKSFLCEQFKKNTGASPINYYLDLKLTEAKRLLREDDLTVTEISSGGKRRIVVCRISLSGIESVRAIVGKDEGLSAIRKARRKIFDYRIDVAPEKSILAVANEGGEEYILLFAYDDEFLSILERNENERDI